MIGKKQRTQETDFGRAYSHILQISDHTFLQFSHIYLWDCAAISFVKNNQTQHCECHFLEKKKVKTNENQEQKQKRANSTEIL